VSVTVPVGAAPAPVIATDTFKVEPVSRVVADGVTVTVGVNGTAITVTETVPLAAA
jgi:hypothetical protein